MSQLLDLLQAVKDKSLSKEQLEEMHTDFTNMYAAICLEMASIEKAEARYFLTIKEELPDLADVAVKRKWRGTPDGQRLIEIKNYEKAVTKVLSSIKNRIYSLL